MWLFLIGFRFLFATVCNTVFTLTFLFVSCYVIGVSEYLQFVINKVVFSPWNASTISVKGLSRHSLYNPVWTCWSLDLHLSPSNWKQHSYVLASDFIVLCFTQSSIPLTRCSTYCMLATWTYGLKYGHLMVKGWFYNRRRWGFATLHASEAREHQISSSLFRHWKLYWRT